MRCVFVFLRNFCAERLLAIMERNQPEWLVRFGAKMRTDRASSVNDPLPKAIAAKLQALEDAEQRLRLQVSEHTPVKRRT
jgi:hypothetical protein